MGFPNRAIIVAPVGRDLSLEVAHTVMIPGATNGVKQLWDTLDQDAWVALADPALSGYGKIAQVPNAVKRHIIQVRRYDDATCVEATAAWKRFADCEAADFIKLKAGGVKAATALAAGDRPLEWDLLHRWLGNVAETLGDEA